MDFQRQNHCDCFDFAVSWPFYRTHCCEVHGWDPGDTEASERPNVERQPSKRRLDRIDRDLVEIRDTLQDHLKSKKTAQPKVWQ